LFYYYPQNYNNGIENQASQGAITLATSRQDLNINAGIYSNAGNIELRNEFAGTGSITVNAPVQTADGGYGNGNIVFTTDNVSINAPVTIVYDPIGDPSASQYVQFRPYSSGRMIDLGGNFEFDPLTIRASDLSYVSAPGIVIVTVSGALIKE